VHLLPKRGHRYRDGATSYLEVVASLTALLQARRSALDLETRQRRAPVHLAQLAETEPTLPK